MVTVLRRGDHGPEVELLQQRLRTDAGLAVVVEWPRRSRDLGWIVSDEVPRAPVRRAA